MERNLGRKNWNGNFHFKIETGIRECMFHEINEINEINKIVWGDKDKNVKQNE